MTITAASPLGTMTTIADLAELVEVQPEATVSRTVVRADGVRVVLFAFAAGQVLTEHTAAMPVLLQVVEGHLRVDAAGRVADLRPGDLIHLDTRLPHAVEAMEDSKLALLMLDNRRAARHESATTARGSEPAAANLLAKPHRCECGHDDGTEPVIDARTLPGLVRHAAIIGAFEALPPGRSLVVIAGHKPRHLLRELAEVAAFEHEYVSEGPDDVHVRLIKPAAEEA